MKEKSDAVFCKTLGTFCVNIDSKAESGIIFCIFFYGNKCLHEKDENLEEATMDGLLVECRAMKGFVSHASCVLLLFHRGGSSGGYAISEIEAHPDGLPNVSALDGLPNISALAE